MRGLLLAFLLLLLPGVAPARAMESAAVRSPRATASLVTDTDAYRPGQPFRLGLRIVMAPGWHTYWRNPGDAGAPPDVSLVLPAGARATGLAWPAPHRQPEGGLMTFGYSGSLLLPLTVTPPPGSRPLTVQARAQWLVCRDVCVPEQGRFTLTLPPGAGGPSAEAPLFAAAAAAVPRASPDAARIAPDGTLSVTGPDLSPATVRDAWFVPDTAGVILAPARQALRLGDGKLSLRLAKDTQFAAGAPLSGVLFLRGPDGVRRAVAITARPGVAAAWPRAMPLWRMLGLALLGGLVLNLMPCVFPVLAMKALALTRLSGQAARAVRADAGWTSAGIIVSFAAMGAAALALRDAGSASGWGFQFQSPLFVTAMVWLLLAIGLVLSGVVGIGSGAASAIGLRLAGRAGAAGSFLSGLLTVLVATPCTAPFMAAAVAAAMLAPPADTLGVFAALGVGLAAPWLVLAAAPGLARLLPRPGVWMEVLRQGLAFPMYAAAVWLLWVLSQESGPAGVLGAGAGAVLVGFAAWALGVAQRAPHGPWRRAGRVASLAAVLAAVAVLPGIAQAPAPGGQALAQAGAVAFSPVRLADLRAAHRPAFVDMTAAWCVTCLVNERVALEQPAVRDAFAAHGVTTLVGDWTRQDAAITAYLRAHGRDGVPLYVFYPAQGQPVVLPQILSEGMVLRAIGAAAS